MASPKTPLSLASILRNDVYAITGGETLRRVQVHELGLRHPVRTIPKLEVAIALAITKGWRIGGGEPVRSVSLTDDGRRLSAKERRRP